jgi:DNA-binding transcriptional LysR family regulator
MELAQIQAFIAAAQRGSFVRAAQALILTQPSLSARIHALETELNTLLFHRLGRGVRLTEAGKAFLPYAQRALETLDQGRATLNALEKVTSGTLQVGSARAIGAYVLPEILARFREEHPGIDVNIRTGRSTEVQQMVMGEEVQVGLARSLRHPDILSTWLYDEEIALVSHPQHHFAIQGEASIYDIAKEPLILYDRDSSYFQLIDRVCREAGVIPNVGMVLDSIEATKRMIERGFGVSFLPAHGISREVEAGTLALIRITEGHHVTLPTSVMVRRARIYSPAVLAFLSVLSRMYEVAVPPLETLDVIKADKKAPAV